MPHPVRYLEQTKLVWHISYLSISSEFFGKFSLFKKKKEVVKGREGKRLRSKKKRGYLRSSKVSLLGLRGTLELDSGGARSSFVQKSVNCLLSDGILM